VSPSELPAKKLSVTGRGGDTASVIAMAVKRINDDVERAMPLQVIECCAAQWHRDRVVFVHTSA
jgi:hypothetical protein